MSSVARCNNSAKLPSHFKGGLGEGGQTPENFELKKNSQCSMVSWNGAIYHGVVERAELSMNNLKCEFCFMYKKIVC